jgi:hypothetical protein
MLMEPVPAIAPLTVSVDDPASVPLVVNVLLTVVAEEIVCVPELLVRLYTVTVPPPPMFPVPDIVTVPAEQPAQVIVPVPAVLISPPEIETFLLARASEDPVATLKSLDIVISDPSVDVAVVASPMARL